MLTIDEAFRKFKSRLELNDQRAKERLGAAYRSSRVYLSRNSVSTAVS